MRITYRRLTLGLAVLAAALVAAAVSSAGSTTATASAKCEEGPVKINGTWWVQYCGPATATARYSGKAVRFTSGRCVTRRRVKILYLGRRVFRGLSPKTKYWELVAAPRRDGVQRKDVFVEWWVGKTHYILGNIKMTFKNKQTQGTYTGQLLLGGKGKATGSFKC
jgi:hypothetical protein